MNTTLRVSRLRVSADPQVLKATVIIFFVSRHPRA